MLSVWVDIHIRFRNKFNLSQRRRITDRRSSETFYGSVVTHASGPKMQILPVVCKSAKIYMEMGASYLFDRYIHRGSLPFKV